MARWQRTLDIADSWHKCKAGEITHHEMAREIETKLRAMKPLSDETAEIYREMLADDFGDLASDPTATDEDFNAVMDELYDWGDTSLGGPWPHKKVCWVETIGAVKMAPVAGCDCQDESP